MPTGRVGVGPQTPRYYERRGAELTTVRDTLRATADAHCTVTPGCPLPLT
jgi:hypothetical protein